MAKARQIERQLLRSYTAEMAELDKKISDMRFRRNSLSQAISGLASVLRSLGIDPDSDEEEGPAAPEAESAFGDVVEDVLAIDYAIRVLRDSVEPLGAKEIERLIAQRGVEVNYYTLSRSLNREASKTDGRVFKVGKRFALKRATTGDPFKFGTEE